ncbi:hypothetical protein HNP37_002040 [Flavobacterium nitrogenifigens]|uniref:Uncharacterized protein n=2 Tax=Flavobacterium TaxID=237 RepID=A0A7W7N7Z8_9FLAO|nr:MULTISPECIES: hypothetical protein [Flavobacterium]MBB4801979.1 hypothetical protein [Flavobacterium nitrogenifigens]MBB6386937.1 hypothetical protein [Flavobacterium notoginsengisoli]
MIQEENPEKSVFEEIPTEKIYSKTAVSAGTFFGGPFVAGYCIAENFKAFNDFEKARNTYIITVVSTILITIIAFNIPENFPSVVFPAVYAFITSFIIQTYQEKDIEKHVNNGGEFFNGWRVFLISIISVVILLAIIYAIAYLLPQL